MSDRKPPGRRQRTGTADLGVVAPAPGREIPPAPHPGGGKKLLAVTVRSWERLWESDVSTIITEPDLEGLGRLFQLYDLRRRLHHVVLAAPMVEGSKGQVRTNPALGDLLKIDYAIGQLEAAFGLTPAARLKLGLTIGKIAKTLESINADFDGAPPDDDPRVIQLPRTS